MLPALKAVHTYLLSPVPPSPLKSSPLYTKANKGLGLLARMVHLLFCCKGFLGIDRTFKIIGFP